VELGDRLTARTGAQVLRPAPGDAHRPERGALARPLSAPEPDWDEEPLALFEDTPLRPLRLFDPPQPIEAVMFEAPEGAPARFTWRRLARAVVRAEGPERLEPEWALDPADARVRDYYRLEDAAGRRYWVFREGRYDAPDIPPPGLAEPRPEPEPSAKGLEPISPVRPAPVGPVAPLALFALPANNASNVVVLAPVSRDRQGRRHGDKQEAQTANAASVTAGAPPPPRWFLHGLFG
jgi:hypothetical protein